MAEDRKQDDGALSRIRTSPASRNLIIFGRRTTVRLEDEMWASFNDIAKCEERTIHELASHIHSRKKSDQSFTSAIRVFVMLYYRDAATEAGHAKAGHGRQS